MSSLETADVPEYRHRLRREDAMRDRVSEQTLASGKLVTLRRYWARKRGRRALPQRRDIDPVDIPGLLPVLILMDVEAAPPRYRFRLVGTRMVELFGQDPTGRYLDEVWSTHEVSGLLPPLDQVIATAGPVASSGRLAWDNGASVDIEWLFLPLGSGGAGVTMILAGADFFSARLQYPEGEPRIELTPALFDRPAPPLEGLPHSA